MKSIEDAVRYQIKHCGMTQKEVAEKTGVSTATISRFMGGKMSLNLATLEKLQPVINLKLFLPTGAEELPKSMDDAMGRLIGNLSDPMISDPQQYRNITTSQAVSVIEHFGQGMAMRDVAEVADKREIQRMFLVEMRGVIVKAAATEMVGRVAAAMQVEIEEISDEMEREADA